MPSQTDSRPSAPPAARKPRTRCTFAGCRKLAPPRRKRCDEHKPGQSARPPGRGPGRKKLLGRAEARVYTKPRRPLTRATTRGYEVIDFAKMIGEPLLPWQEFAVIHALELNPDATYRFRTVLILVARQNGKSHLKRIVTLWRMYMDGARRIIGVAQDLALARDQWQMCQDTIHACPDLEEEWAGVRNVNGDEMFWASGARYAIKAATGKAGRGGSNDEVNIDELREQRDWKTWAAVSKTTSARENGQTWAMSNAGDDSSVVLNQLQEAALAGTSSSICLLEWSAPEGCELDDTGAWEQANPGLGHTVSEEAIRSSLGTDPPDVFRTEVLCQRVRKLDGAVDGDRWDACADAGGILDLRRGKVTACFDVSPDGEHATLAIATALDDGRVRIAIAGAWKSTEDARAELGKLLDKIRPRAVAWYPSGPAAAFATILRKRPGSAELTGGRVAEVCQEFADVVKSARVVHPADTLLDAHVHGATKLRTGDGWRFVRVGGGHVDAAYAAAGAVNLALTIPVTRSRIRIIS